MILPNRRPALAWTVVFFTCTCLHADPSVDDLVTELRQGHIAPVKAAITSAADANLRDRYGNTLLMHAAVYATPELLTFLLEHGADVNAANPAGHTALMRAVPDLAKVKLLIEHGASVNAATVDGTTPLLLAARIHSASPLVAYLVKNGADIRAVDVRGSDAVMLAAGAAASENLRILLAAGASGDARRKVTGRPRQFAEINKNIVERGRRAADGSTALMGAAAANCEDCVRLLLSHGADVTAKTGSGLTALHDAAFEGNPSIVRMLIDAGAPVNAADERGFTPLMMAANSRTKSPVVVRMLLAHDADVHMNDSEGRTASDWAGIAAPRELAALLPASRTLPGVKPASGQDDASPKDIRAAVEKSISLLGGTAPAFFRQTGCISCHNVSIPMLALTEARRRGYRVVDAASAEQMVKQTVAILAPHRDNLLSAYASVPGFVTTATYALMSMHGEGYRPDLLTDAIARSLLVEQQSDGHWKTGGARPPLSPDSPVPTTALAARALTLYPVPALSGATRDSIARARTWLLNAKPQVADDYAYRLLGLSWTSAAGTELEGAANDLISRQRPDGGWSQTPNMPSDAYATGLVLSALAIAQPSTLDTTAYSRGVDYLLATQESGGSWHVRTRAFGFQPYFESGFPHGHDQWISMAATAWSSYALMAAPPRPQVTAVR
jgi:ankyrin repeat protein